MKAATFDLRTGVGRVPDPLDYITKKTACRCAPAGTPHPLWTKFLERVTDHSGELQGFLQRYLGYCCTGFTTEHVFVFAYGAAPTPAKYTCATANRETPRSKQSRLSRPS